MELSPHSLTAGIFRRYSEFDSVAELAPFTTKPVALPPLEHFPTLVLKLFRREPAITKLDKLFTSYPSSSEDFAQSTGSDLPSIFIEVHPGQGKLAWLRVLHQLPVPDLAARDDALLTLGFPMAPSE